MPLAYPVTNPFASRLRETCTYEPAVISGFAPTVLALNLSLLSAPTHNPLSLVPSLKSIKRRALFASSNLHRLTRVHRLCGMLFVDGDGARPRVDGNFQTVVEA